MSKIGIVVSSGSKIVRRVVVPDVSEDEINNHPLAVGEQMVVADNPGTGDPTAIGNLVQQATGVTPPSSRCAVVVKANAVSGNVVGAIHADPAIDTIHGATLMLHPTAVAGWTWSAAQGLQPPASAVG